MFDLADEIKELRNLKLFTLGQKWPYTDISYEDVDKIFSYLDGSIIKEIPLDNEGVSTKFWIKDNQPIMFLDSCNILYVSWMGIFVPFRKSIGDSFGSVIIRYFLSIRYDIEIEGVVGGVPNFNGILLEKLGLVN
jgi:hypothetical protein